MSDLALVEMAAPRPIKGILKNKNSGTGIKVGPAEEVPVETPEQVDPGLLEDDQQWVDSQLAC